MKNNDIASRSELQSRRETKSPSLSESEVAETDADLTSIHICKTEGAILNNQMSVLDFVRVSNNRRNTAVNMVNCLFFEFSVRKRLLFLLTFLGLFAGLIDIGIRA